MSIAAESLHTFESEPVKLSRFARLIAFDQRLLRRLVQSRRARATFLLRSACRLYDPDMVIMAVAVALFHPALVDVANRAGVALAATSLLAYAVKRAVRRSRPNNELHASVPPDRYSFPSGHTAAAFSLAIAMFGAVPWLALPLLLMAMVVGYGRMYLGVHYPLDVAAGAAIGLITGSVLAILQFPQQALVSLPSF
ncbi:MAG: phosphatase PAP2 family protein [Deltaproteobacteria bacterium]|nr:phosphatase PAP2 family protein [Deltaproteobacteria bacterium]